MKKLNKGKRGRPYRYSEGLFMFLAYLYAFMRNYRILEGLCRAFSRIVKEFPVPDHSTIHRRLKAKFQVKEISGKILIVDQQGLGWEERQIM